MSSNNSGGGYGWNFSPFGFETPGQGNDVSPAPFTHMPYPMPVSAMPPPPSSSVVNPQKIAQTTPPMSNNLGQPSSSGEDLNILILGQTGVGKTTWINAFYNYLQFPKLKEAEEAGLDFLIPMQITVTDDDFNEIVVECGSSSNECYNAGESCTKQPVCYEFQSGSRRRVHLIDTPGIGDCAGISQDDQNFNMIIKHVQSVNQVHAILILLKPNESRLDVTFNFCLKQLLLYLPRQACKNIVFCFTNTRGTNYKPGETLNTLRTLLKSGDIAIELNKSTMYCFDNESVRFLAARKNGINYNSSEIESFSSSWKIAVTETERLFDHVSNLVPVGTSTVATIKETRDLVQLLLKPIVDISVLIQDNIRGAEERQKNIAKGKDLCYSLSIKTASIPIKTYEFQKLKTSRTVCASPTCKMAKAAATATPGEGSSSIVGTQYRTVCHDKCKIVAFKTLGWTCKCFNWKWDCKHCKCPFSKHLNVNFETRLVEKPDPILQAELSKAKTSLERNEILAADAQRIVDDLTREQAQILEACVTFHDFLQSEALIFYNDAMEDYLQMLIQTERNLTEREDSDSDDDSSSRGSSKLERLEQMLESYKEQIRMQKEFFSNDSVQARKIHSCQDIFELMEKLYRLPRMGASIKSLVEQAKEDADRNFQPQSVQVELQQGNFLNSMMDRLNRLSVRR